MGYDCMTYQPGMETIESDIIDIVLADINTNEKRLFTHNDVQGALNKDYLDPVDFAALLSPAAGEMLESIAVRAKEQTAKYFGNGIRLFTPLYIANHCVNSCIYCGYNCKNNILRGKLTNDEIRKELDAIATTGLDEVLILTGESRTQSDVDYIGSAVKLAAEVFGTVGVEIYPCNVDEYAFLNDCGADFVSVYQETYNLPLYDRAHPSGPKRCFPYRFHSQERALLGGVRGVSFGVLLGLGDARRDAYAAGLHAYLILRKYPHAEIAMSVPRIRAFENHPDGGVHGVDERLLLQIMMAYRLFLPFAGLTISTREGPLFRDNVVGLCATKISAGVSVGVGGHESEAKGGDQFVISDPRSVDEIHSMLKKRNLQPIYTDYINIIRN